MCLLRTGALLLSLERRLGFGAVNTLVVNEPLSAEGER